MLEFRFNKVVDLQLSKLYSSKSVSCEIWEVLKNTFSYRIPPVAVSISV